MENLKLKKNERGISLIALVITIIVIIILAAIAFNSSTNTISKANYSKFVSNIGEVQDAIQTKTVTVKDFAMASGTQVTDGQAYNYVAKGGSSESAFLTEAQVPDYTIIEETADIGIDLPEIKVNTPTETGVKVKYAVTKEGKVFIWPPYSYENEYNIRDKETVDKSLVGVEGELDIKVADKDLKIKTDEKGMLLNISVSGIETGPTQEEILAKIKVGDYVNYVPTSNTVTTDTTKTGCTSSQTLTTDTNTQWRILSIDETTGEILLTIQRATITDMEVTLRGATGYLHGAEELNRICKELYSNTEKGITARSMTVEDINKAVGYDPATDTASDNPDYGEEYTYTSGTFYTYEENGKTVTSETPKEASSSNPVTVKKTYYNYDPSSKNSTVGNILGNSSGWLASPYVYLDSEDAIAGYGLRTAYTTAVYGHYSVYSAGGVSAPSWGVRPVVSLSSKLLDIGDESKDGTTVATAWNLK